MERLDRKTLSDSSLRSSFAKILLMHSHHPAYWYHVNYVESSNRNLSTYIGWQKDEYHDVLEALGLLKRTQNGQLWHQNKAWDARQRFDDSNWTVQQVSEIDPKIRKLRWVRLGSVGNANLFDPKSQPSSVKICSFPMLERKNLSDRESSIASLVLFTARVSLELQQDKDALKLIAEEEYAENASNGVVGRTCEPTDGGFIGFYFCVEVVNRGIEWLFPDGC